MEITLSMVEEIPVMSLSGRLDVTTSPILEERLLPVIEGAGSKIILDCSELTYVSSAGLRVFITSQRRLAEHGGGLAFFSHRGLLALAGLGNGLGLGQAPHAVSFFLGVFGVALVFRVEPLGGVLARDSGEAGVDFKIVAADKFADLFFALHHH